MGKKINNSETKSKNSQLIDTAKQKFSSVKHHTRLRVGVGRLLQTPKGRILAIAAGIGLLLIVIFAIPFTRYVVLGPIIKKDVTIVVIDSQTQKPITNATVSLGSVNGQTDKDGVAKLTGVPVGQPDLTVTKAYYQDYQGDYTVPVLFAPVSPQVQLSAEGRQLLVSVTNKLTADPLADVVITSGDVKVTTDSAGLATVILPPTEEAQAALLSKDGYNSSNVELPVVEPGKTLDLAITPAGSLYYLSKATGKISVMKADLDGSNASIFVAGTGQESDSETTLLSARDWQYSALLATRTDNKQRLYLVDNAKGDFTVMDEGNATFRPIGWSGHSFIYVVDRITPNYWDDKKVALKSFNAETRKISLLDETQGGQAYGYASESINAVYIIENEIVYLKVWYNSYSDKTDTLMAINPANGAKRTIKTFSPNSTNIKLYEPQGVYIRTKTGNNPATFYEYEDGKIETVTDTNDNRFYSIYATYLVSPSGHKTLWYEQRDGKNIVFIGNNEGKDAQAITQLSDYIPYGWFGANDEYILLSKNGSELYIAATDKVASDQNYQPYKITNYHKTATYNGYGYGYGGQ